MPETQEPFIGEDGKARPQYPASHRWNIERDGADLLVCEGLHEKAEGCTYERYVTADSVPRWRPISTAPKDGTWVMLYAPPDKYHSARMYVATWEATNYNSPPQWAFGPNDGEHAFRSGVYGATHWQPLPAPPEATSSPDRPADEIEITPEMIEAGVEEARAIDSCGATRDEWREVVRATYLAMRALEVSPSVSASPPAHTD